MSPRVPRTVLLVGALRPEFGLERATLELADRLGLDDIACIGQDGVARGPGAAAVVLGPPLDGLAKLRSPGRVWRWLRTRALGADDVILAVGVWAALPLLLLPVRIRARCVVWEHTLTRQRVAASRSKRVLSWCARVAYRRAATVVCVSDALAEDVRSWLAPEKVVVIPNFRPEPGGQRSAARPRSSPGVDLLTVGNLTRLKNHRLAIGALRHLPESFRLRVAGDGELHGELVEFARQCGVGNRVDFLGYQADMEPEYRRASIVLQPSVAETFGIAMFEAAEHHVPVVAVDFSVPRDVVPDYVPGILVAPDEVAVAEACRALVEDPVTQTAFERADAARAERYAGERICQAWRAVLGQQEPVVA